MVSRIQDTMQCLYFTGVWTQIFSMQHYPFSLSCMATKLAPYGTRQQCAEELTCIHVQMYHIIGHSFLHM